MEKRRNVALPVYNENRLYENPIPSGSGVGGAECSNSEALVFDGSSENSESDGEQPSFEEVIIETGANDTGNLSVGSNNTSNPLNISGANSVVGNEPEQIDSNENVHSDNALNDQRATVEREKEQNVLTNENDRTDSVEVGPTIEASTAVSSSKSTADFDGNKENRDGEPNATDSGSTSATVQHAVLSVENTSQEQSEMENRNELAEPIEADPVQAETSNNIDVPTPSTSAVLNESYVDSKPNVLPLYELHRADHADILDMLEDKTVYVVDDEEFPMEITVTSKGYGQPFNSTTEFDLIKREEPDEISRNIPFVSTVI